MAGVPKTIRLRKVASEFNLGISTVVDFLSQKGFELESNPNAKISNEMYAALQEEFQTEKTAREELRLFGADAVEHETISLDDIATKTTRKKQEQEEVLIKNIENVSGIGDIIKAKPIKKDITIVGKIDIEKKETKSKPTKEEPEEKTEKIEVKEEKKEEEVIRAKIEKVDGPKVMGKIELPVKKEKKKLVASSAEEKDTDKPRKKRRKRIKQEPVDKIKAGGERKSRFRKGRKEPKPELTEGEIQSQIKETLAQLSGTGKSKASKYRRAKREAVSEQKEEDLKRLEKEKTVLKVTEYVTANELATMMEVSANEIISACMSLGLIVSINQRLDAETLSIVAEEFGFKVEFISAELQEAITVEEDDPDKLHERSPIVTVMGHVDHGKTLLLDYIRKANVIAGEAGGITQHIGAYSVELDNEKRITFLDTPGHEAFTAMRARGAQITDIAIIVIAADDSIMPQTKEAINHAQAANVPMIFAINKIDKPGANPEKIKEQLSAMNILVEDWGGKFQSQDISAKKGTNIEELLEKVLLEAEMLELKAVSEKNALGTIIESELDKGRGYVTTILVESGTLKAGDILLAGCYYGKVKAMHNERGKEIKEALPSVPVSVLGLNGAPNAGDKFNVLDDEREARIIATKRLQLQREQGVRTQKHITLDEIGRRIAVGDFQELNIIIKGDVDGSVEALADALVKLTTETIQINVIHKSVGQISESDVMLATASDAVIVGFQVRPSSKARKLAETEQIDIRLYSVIYDAIEEVKAAMEGMLAPTIEERIVCNIEVREVYKITKVGTIAGCYVQDGKVTRKTKVRLLREGIVVYTGALGSLKRFKDDVKEVTVGYECGLNIENFNDIKVGDIIEGFEEIEIKSTL